MSGFRWDENAAMTQAHIKNRWIPRIERDIRYAAAHYR